MPSPTPVLKPALFTAFLCLGSPSQAAPLVLDCLVDEFHGQSETMENAEFVSHNIEKTFRIIATESTIYLRTFSQHFDASENEYKVIHTTSLDTYGVDLGVVNFGTIAIGTTETNGIREATVSVQGSIYLNAWHLLCKEG